MITSEYRQAHPYECVAGGEGYIDVFGSIISGMKNLFSCNTNGLYGYAPAWTVKQHHLYSTHPLVAMKLVVHFWCRCVGHGQREQLTGPFPTGQSTDGGYNTIKQDTGVWLITLCPGIDDITVTNRE